MSKKPRCFSCSVGWCKNHVFELNPLSSNLYYRKNFKIRLCPRLNKESKQFQKIIPFFNADKKFYTPSFYLDQEKKYYIKNEERIRKNHDIKVQEDDNSNKAIWVPRHARKRNYCFVCKTDYNDYLQHVSDQVHKKCLRGNHYTALILGIESKFAEKNQTEKQQKKQEELKREVSTQDSSSISERSPKCFQFIRKLIKPNEKLLKINSQIVQQN